MKRLFWLEAKLIRLNWRLRRHTRLVTPFIAVIQSYIQYRIVETLGEPEPCWDPKTGKVWNPAW